MGVIFYSALAIICIVEIYIVYKLIKKKNKTILKQATFPLIVFFLYLIAVYLLNLNIPYYVLLLSLLTVFIDALVGRYLDYYNKSKTFDRFLHAFGTFSFALLFFYTLINLTEPGGSKFLQAAFIAAIGIANGAAFEIIEFAIDSKQKQKQNIKHQRGLKDTNFDIIFNIIGSLSAALFAYSVFL
jgi:hypothetical protein